MDTKHYTYRVFWSDEDQEFVAMCAEFPSLSWLDEDQGAALAGINQLVKDVVEDMTLSGEVVPKPISTKKFSGKISLRITPDTHREIAVAAAEHKVSINRFLNSLITGTSSRLAERDC